MPDNTFDDRLAREILHAQRLRAGILAVVFAGGTALLATIAGVDASLERGLGFPRAPVLLVAAMAAHQLGLRLYLDRRQDRRVPEAFWQLNALVEVTGVTAALVLIQGVFANPLHALLTPAPFVYFVFVILSTLRLDARASVVTGATAAGQFLLLALWLLGRQPSVGPAIEPLFASPYPYLMKAFLLLAGGVAAGFVARELRSRFSRSVAAVAERERAEAAGEAKAAFLANMSHEIRTPLNAILGHAELLAKDAALTPDQAHAVRTMRASGDHLLGVINQVLDLSRIEAGREELDVVDLDLRELMAELTGVFDLRCRARGLRWRAEVESPAPLVRGDAVRLRQVLINLAGNAVRYTAEGEVTVLVRLRDDGRHEFEVRDTGPGIPAGAQAEMFEPFRKGPARSSERGSGLGLAIAHAQVRLMGGQLTLESAAGAGTRLTFALDLGPVPEATRLPRRLEAVGLAPGRGVAAVVADDDPVGRALLAAMLRRIGVVVREAESGEAVLAAVAAAPADLVFLDARMPGFTGAETLARLAEASGGAARPSVVVVSASVLEHERRALLAEGYDAFLARPVDTAALYGCMGALLGLEYEWAEIVEPVPADPASRRAVMLPSPLWRSLHGAAEGFNVTDLRKHLRELDALGDAARPLAEHLRHLSRRYDMEAIRAALDEVPHA